MRLRSTMPMAPLPVGESKPMTLAKRNLAGLGRGNDGGGQRMLARLLDAGRETQDFRFLETFRGHDGSYRRPCLP